MTKAKRNETAEVATVEAQAMQVAYVAEKDRAREAQLASEINLITEQTKQMVLMNFIELGKRLTEAKREAVRRYMATQTAADNDQVDNAYIAGIRDGIRFMISFRLADNR